MTLSPPLSITPTATTERLLATITLAALDSVFILSFVPIPVFINLSQVILLLLCISVLCCPSTYFRSGVVFQLFLTFCIACSQAIAITHSPASEKNYLTPLMFIASLLIGPVALALARTWPPGILSSYLSRPLNIILVCLTLECVSRLIFSPGISPAVETSEQFYLYKTSLFYVDSNFVGIALICLIPVIFSHADLHRNKRLILAYVLLFATFSRASIVAGICQFLMYKFWRRRRWLLIGLTAVQAVIIGTLFVDFTTHGSGNTQAIDPSFSTKFYILDLMTQSYANADTVQRLFGIGAGNADNLIGIFAHNIIATFSIELGTVGSILVTAYVLTFARRCPEVFYLLIFPMVINGFSLVSTSMPYFFAALGLLGALHYSPRQGTKQHRRGIGSSERSIGSPWPESAY
jgi:hypothetical protein